MQESRIAFYDFFGFWPKNFACHRCDNKRCIEPRHIFDGTHIENMADGVSKNRFPRGLSSPAARRGLGENDRILDLWRAGCSGSQIRSYLNLRGQRPWHVIRRYQERQSA